MGEELKNLSSLSFQEPQTVLHNKRKFNTINMRLLNSLEIILAYSLIVRKSDCKIESPDSTLDEVMNVSALILWLPKKHKSFFQEPFMVRTLFIREITYSSALSWSDAEAVNEDSHNTVNLLKCAIVEASYSTIRIQCPTFRACL